MLLTRAGLASGSASVMAPTDQRMGRCHQPRQAGASGLPCRADRSCGSRCRAYSRRDRAAVDRLRRTSAGTAGGVAVWKRVRACGGAPSRVRAVTRVAGRRRTWPAGRPAPGTALCGESRSVGSWPFGVLGLARCRRWRSRGRRAGTRTPAVARLAAAQRVANTVPVEHDAGLVGALGRGPRRRAGRRRRGTGRQSCGDGSVMRDRGCAHAYGATHDRHLWAIWLRIRPVCGAPPPKFRMTIRRPQTAHCGEPFDGRCLPWPPPPLLLAAGCGEAAKLPSGGHGRPRPPLAAAARHKTLIPTVSVAPALSRGVDRCPPRRPAVKPA